MDFELEPGADRAALGPDLQDESVAQCVSGHVRIAVEIHFLQNSRAVGADRFYAQAQFVGDFSNPSAGREFAEYLELPNR